MHCCEGSLFHSGSWVLSAFRLCRRIVENKRSLDEMGMSAKKSHLIWFPLRGCTSAAERRAIPQLSRINFLPPTPVSSIISSVFGSQDSRSPTRSARSLHSAVQISHHQNKKVLFVDLRKRHLHRHSHCLPCYQLRKLLEACLVEEGVEGEEEKSSCLPSISFSSYYNSVLRSRYGYTSSSRSG